MRPFSWLMIVVFLFLFTDGVMLSFAVKQGYRRAESLRLERQLVAALTLTDLCLSTEARYTRHPSVSDPVVPFMDHPGAIEHFPSGSFWSPPSL